MDSKKQMYISMGVIVVVVALGVGAFSFVSQAPSQDLAGSEEFDLESLALEPEFLEEIPVEQPVIEEPVEQAPEAEESPANEENAEEVANENTNEQTGDENTSENAEESSSSTVEFAGNVVAGNKTKFIEFNSGDYNNAKEAGKTVVLYFYADWCPICRAETLVVGEAFNEIDNDNVVGFRVNFDDSNTDDAEKDLAKEFSVTYQHTKVIIKSDGTSSVDGNPWADKQKYVDEIESALRS